MLRLPALAYLLLLLHATAMAQMQRPVSYEAGFLKDGYIGIHGGMAIPLGEFADKEITNLKSGYADLGYTMNIELKYAFTSFFGISMKYFYTVNPMDHSDLESDYNSLPVNARDATWKYESDPWALQGLMIMPSLMWSSDRQVIDLSVGGGWVNGTLPANTVDIFYLNPSAGTARVEQGSFDNSGLAFTAGMGVRYRLFGNFIGSAKADYTYSEITFTNLSYKASSNQGTFMIHADDYVQQFSIIHLSAGIGYQFD